VDFGRLFTGGIKGCQAKCLPENDSIVTKTIWHGFYATKFRSSATLQQHASVHSLPVNCST
jgi:hypothetical protein